MRTEDWTQVITASVSPVVVISASALLCLTFYNRLANIINRLRAVQRERLEVQDRLDSASSVSIDESHLLRLTCILESLSDQTTHIRRRARLIRAALVSLLSAIGALVACSLFIGLTQFVSAAAPVAAALFVSGLLLLTLSVSCAARELFSALAPAEFETDIISELTGWSPPSGARAKTPREHASV